MSLPSIFTWCSSNCNNFREKQILKDKEILLETDDINIESEIKNSYLPSEKNSYGDGQLEHQKNSRNKDENVLILYPENLRKATESRRKNNCTPPIDSTCLNSDIPLKPKTGMFEKNSLKESPSLKTVFKENIILNKKIFDKIDNIKNESDLMQCPTIKEVKSALIIQNVVNQAFSSKIPKIGLESSWKNSLNILHQDSFQINKNNSQANYNLKASEHEKGKENTPRLCNLNKPNKIISISLKKNTKYIGKKPSIPQGPFTNNITKKSPSRIKLIDDIKRIQTDYSRSIISNNTKPHIKTNNAPTDFSFKGEENLYKKANDHKVNYIYTKPIRSIAKSKTNSATLGKCLKKSTLKVKSNIVI